MTVTGGRVATAVGLAAACGGASISRADRDRAGGQHAEGEDGGKEVVVHGGLPVDWAGIGDAVKAM